MKPTVEGQIGDVVRWGDVIMMIVKRVNTNGGEKWQCLVLDTCPAWAFAYKPGDLHYFRDIDFTERLA